MNTKCCVCASEIPEGIVECPCCGFLDERRIRVLGSQISDEQVEADAAAHRKQFLQGIDIGILTYRWKDDNGAVVPDGESRVSFGRGDVILEQPQWLSQKFARVPGADKITATLSVRRAGQPEKQLKVEVGMLPQAELQQAGVSLSTDMKLRLLVKNSTASTESQPVSLL